MKNEKLKTVIDKLTLLQVRCIWKTADEPWEEVYKLLEEVDKEISELRLFTTTPCLTNEKLKEILKKYDEKVDFRLPENYYTCKKFNEQEEHCDCDDCKKERQEGWNKIIGKDKE